MISRHLFFVKQMQGKQQEEVGSEIFGREGRVRRGTDTPVEKAMVQTPGYVREKIGQR